MAKDKKVEQITDMEVDFAQWFTDVCTKAELVDYSGIKGLFVLRPYGYAIWENIQAALDAKFKATGHVNVSMPMLIPESLLQKEKDHVEGFAPECAWVTVGGSEELPERLCIRPTSETLFCEHWSHVVHSPGAICPACTTSGAACCAGKRPPARSCAGASSSGRRATPYTPLQEEAREETHPDARNLRRHLPRTGWPCLSSAATRPRRRSLQARRTPIL